MKNAKKQYDYNWSQISIRPATKELLLTLCEKMGNTYASLPMSTVIDLLIKEKLDQFNTQK